MHDGVFGVAEEVGGTAEAVEHTRAHDAGRVGVGVDVDLDGGVHADDTEATDDLRVVGDRLAAEKQLVVVGVPVVVETLEAVGGETDGGGGRVVETAGVEEVEEGVLNNLSPDGHVAEVGLVQTTDDGVGNVANAALKGEKVLRKTAVSDLVLEEFNEVASDAERVLVGIGVREGGVLVVGLDNANNLGGVDLDRGATNAILDVVDLEWLAVRGEVGPSDVVEAVERRNGGVHLDDDLVGHLHELRGRADRCTRDNAAILLNICGLDNCDIELVVWPVLGVVAL